MTRPTLNAAQVAMLLVSASCGIGFVLGTGELALHQGIAGSLYAVSTAVGLLVLAATASFLCTGRQSMWSWFEKLHGTSVSRTAAAMSLVWMTGVLAAQLRGGAAILAMAGLRPTHAMLVIDGLLLALSTFRLAWLSAALGICMLASNLALIGALIETHRLDVWTHAPTQLINTLPQLPATHIAFTLITVAVMVVCGADYQQFLIAARAPSAARLGCILAAGLVLAIGFLPAGAVMATATPWHLKTLPDPVQAIPAVLVQTLSLYAIPASRGIVIVMLVATALGAGSAVLRAMTDATATLWPEQVTTAYISRILPIVLGSLVAARGQSLVDMMVDLNIVYLLAVGPLLALAILNVRLSNRAAHATIVAGCGIAMTYYLLSAN